MGRLILASSCPGILDGWVGPVVLPDGRTVAHVETRGHMHLVALAGWREGDGPGLPGEAWWTDEDLALDLDRLECRDRGGELARAVGHLCWLVVEHAGCSEPEDLEAVADVEDALRALGLPATDHGRHRDAE